MTKAAQRTLIRQGLRQGQSPVQLLKYVDATVADVIDRAQDLLGGGSVTISRPLVYRIAGQRKDYLAHRARQRHPGLKSEAVRLAFEELLGVKVWTT